MKISIRIKLAAVFFATVLIFSVAGLFLIWRTWSFTASFYRDVPQAFQRMDEMDELDHLAHDIQYYDEILTQSARNYAFTLDKFWKERYRKSEPILESIIKEAVKRGDDSDKSIFGGIDDANAALVEMEHAAIKSVDEGRAQDAIAILQGADYAARKRAYSNGLDNYSERRKRESKNVRGATMAGLESIIERRKDILNMFVVSLVVFVIFSAALFAAIYILIAKTIIRPLTALQGSAKRVASGDINQHIYLNTGDEIEDVANEFNAMIFTLGALLEKNERYIKDLEETNNKLTEKDRQLSELNKNLEDMRAGLEAKVEERTKYLTHTQQAVLNIMGDLQDSKQDVDQANIIIKKAYEEIKDTQARLVQAEKMSALGRFSSGIAHEVKNPLAIILGGMEYLQKKLETADLDTRTALEKIKDAVFRADRVIQNLLRFARPSRMEMEKMKLRDVVEDTLAFFKYKAPLINVQIEKIYPEKSIPVMIDKNQMQQVLFNLVSNSVDAMPRGGTVTISVYEKTIEISGVPAPYCVVEVADTGEGISDSDKSRLWEPFFTTKRDKGGTGLGLPVSRAIVENHKGFLEIESEYRKGTIARVILPVAS